MDYAERARAAVPDLDGTVRVAGLEEPVEVLRDGLGIPHVRARTTLDAFFGQGFVHAQDRLWQMEQDRRRSAGRLAELLGRQALAFDVFARRMQLDAAARADHDALDEEARAVLAAYAAGVNAFIATARALPLEMELLGIDPEPWEPWRCAGVMKVRHVLMGTMDVKLWRARLMRALGPEAALLLGSGHGRHDLTIVPVGSGERWQGVPEELDALAGAVEALKGGSNNWAVHGSRTASGKPMLAGDPHRLLEAPNVYYQNHIACPEFDAIGFSIPGVPGLFHFGHNERVAWGITHAMADTQDLYVERFDGRGRWLHEGEWVELEHREERVEVRDEEPVTIPVVTTRNGPVVLGDPSRGVAVSMRWTGTDRANGSLGAVLPMLRARTAGELEEAMRAWVDPCNNFVMADVDGTIAYLHRGRVPVRDARNAWGPVPGWTGEHAWTGDVPFEELPRLRNPETGFIVTANNRVASSDYEHYLAMDYSAPNRARRIIERLSVLERATPEDMAAIHADRVSIAARAWVRAVADLPLSGRAAEAREIMLAWDGSMDPDAAAPAICAAFRDRLGETLLELDTLRPLREPLFGDAEPDPTLPGARLRAFFTRFLVPDGARFLGEATWPEVATRAFQRALAMLDEQLGEDMRAWRWRDVHTTRTEHPLSAVFPDAARELDPPAVPLAGDADTVCVGTAEEGLGVEHSSVARYVFDLGDWDRSGWVVPLGASGHPGSPHYADQAVAWSEVRLHRMTYSWDVIEAEAGSRQVLDAR